MADNDLLELWKEAQSRVIDLAKNASEHDLNAQVPTTPEWTARDLLAHMVGVNADVVANSVPNEASPTWTQGHVDQRSQQSVTQVLNEWQEMTPEIERVMETAPDQVRNMIVADVAIHEQDLRGAINQKGERGNAAIINTANFLMDGLAQKLHKANLPAIDMRGNNITRVVGNNESGPTLRTDAFEVTRLLTGRRSPHQVRNLNWEGDCSPYIDQMQVVGQHRGTDLDE